MKKLLFLTLLISSFSAQANTIVRAISHSNYSDLVTKPKVKLVAATGSKPVTCTLSQDTLFIGIQSVLWAKLDEAEQAYEMCVTLHKCDDRIKCSIHKEDEE